MTDSNVSYGLNDELRASLHSSLNAINLLVELGVESNSSVELLNKALNILIHNEKFEYCAFYGDCNIAFEPLATASVDQEFTIEGENDLLPSLVAAEKDALFDLVKNMTSTKQLVENQVLKIKGQKSQMICANLLSHGKYSGLLVAFHSEDDFFDSWHERTLKTYSKMLQHLLDGQENRLILEQEVHKRTEELKVASDEACKSSLAKSEFLASMSHEIRTPMNAILGFSQLLQLDSAEPLSLEQDEYVRHILESGNHLLGLIDDVLDMSKIESGLLELSLQPVSLIKLINDISHMFELRCNEKDLSWQVEHSVSSGVIVEMDVQRVRQILVNLISNSIKFTEQGFVKFKVYEKEKGYYQFEVSDSGMGMSPEEMAEVFEPFVQKGAGIKHGGTGLGLSISQKHAQLMGAVITVNSELGKGACFGFALPMNHTDVNSGPNQQVVSHLTEGQNIRALVVDDEKTSRILLLSLLEEIGVQVCEARNGVEALKQLKNNQIDIIFLDIQMPIMTGLEALKYIVGMDEKPKCIAVSAFIKKEDVERYIQSGFHDVITKPFKFDTIFNCLQKQLSVEFKYR